MEPNENLLSSDLQVDEIAAFHLRETARWAKFLGIFGMILSGLFALIGIFAGFLLSAFSTYSRSPLGMMGSGFISLFYVIIAAILFIMSLFLYIFGNKMRSALQSVDQLMFNDALLNLKRYYRIAGIITIIYIGIIVILFLFGIVGAIFMRN